MSSKTKAKFSEIDSKLSMMIERRGLSKGAIKNYDTVFNEIYDLFDVTPSEIVRIGKRDQKPFSIEDGSYDLLDLEDRKVTEYQFKYYNHLKNKGLSDRTIKLKLDTFRALLGEYNIEKPKPIRIIIKTDRIRDEDIVSWRDVENALSFTKSIRDKALISFFATTGLRSIDIRNLTIDDLINACSIYFDKNEEKTLNNLLIKNPDEIMPCWEIMPSKTSKKSQLCVTFNTFESSKYIWQYLKDRIENNVKKGGETILNSDEPLFATLNNKPLYSTAIEQLFQRINKQLGNLQDKNGNYGKFRAHSLRKLFSTTIRRNITQVVVNSDKTSEIDVVSIFTGHVPPNESNSKVYEAIESDSHDSYLRKTYLALSPFLSIQDIEIKDIKTEQYKDLEEKNMLLQEKIENEAVKSQRIINEQKEHYEKKIRHLESVNSSLSSRIESIQTQIDDISNHNNINEIQKYIIDNEIVNKYNLANEVMKLYKLDISNDDLIIVDKSYIDTLIACAYNKLPSYRTNTTRDDGKNKQDDLEYSNLKKKILAEKDFIIESNNFLLSEIQIKLIKEEVMLYCDKLWWDNIYTYEKDVIENIIFRIAKEGFKN